MSHSPCPQGIGARSWPTSPRRAHCGSGHFNYLAPHPPVFIQKTRRLLAALPLFLFLPFPTLPSALLRPCAFSFVAPPHGTTRTSCLLIICPMPLWSASMVNYWLVQAILAADVGNSVVRAHDVRKFAYSINWARRAGHVPTFLNMVFWASAHPFLHYYLTPLEGALAWLCGGRL